MKDLKVLFIEDIDVPLCYTIYELKQQKNGYYTLNPAPQKIRNNLKNNIENEHQRYCYVVTLENRIIGVIYKEKIHTLKQVVQNLYEFDKIENKNYTVQNKTLSKKFKI